MPGEGEISLEQLYKMLHVSKRKAAWMLNNGIIPCRIRQTATHRYIIRLEDVEIYLQKQRKARREEMRQAPEAGGVAESSSRGHRHHR